MKAAILALIGSGLIVIGLFADVITIGDFFNEKMGAKEREMEADVVSVLHVSPQANLEFARRFTSPSLAQYGRTVTEAWTRVDCPEKFLAISSETLLTNVELAVRANHAEWAKWLLLRYGWWRQ